MAKRGLIEPCHKYESGANVSTLHSGLMQLIRYQPSLSDPDRDLLKRHLQQDGNQFGDWTADIVSLWQGQFVSPLNWWNFPKRLQLLFPPGTRPTGDVDQRTADALNWAVKKFAPAAAIAPAAATMPASVFFRGERRSKSTGKRKVTKKAIKQKPKHKAKSRIARGR